MNIEDTVTNATRARVRPNYHLHIFAFSKLLILVTRSMGAIELCFRLADLELT
jgi:hypothetical protein